MNLEGLTNKSQMDGVLSKKYHQHSWKKPPIGMVKFNWDVAMDKSHGSIGISIVVQDHEGIVLGAHSTTRNILVEPAVAKALAAYICCGF